MVRTPWEITEDMFLSESEADELVAHVRKRVGHAGKDERPAAVLDAVIIETLLFSGMRTSEFCTLTLADSPAGLKKPVFRVRGGKNEERMVHVPKQMAALAQHYVADVRPGFLPAGASKTDPKQPFVFNERRRPYERSGLYRRVVRILGEAGVADRASIQLLRHTYGYLAYKRSGGNLLFVQRQLGHAHPGITAIYAQFVDESYPNLADRVGSVYVRTPKSDKPA